MTSTSGLISSAGLLSENRREILDFTSTRKQSEQEKEQELERAKAKLASSKEASMSEAMAAQIPGIQLESVIIPPPKHPSAQEALETEGTYA